MENTKNIINWFSIPTSNFERAVKFYEKILGIEMPREKMPDGTNMTFFGDTDSESDKIGGDINDSPDSKPHDDGVLIFFDRDGKIDKTIELVKEAGGSVVMPKIGIGKWGLIAKIKDTEGNLIGLHSKS